MKISKLGLVLLTSTCSHAFILDKSCGDAKGNLAMRVKKSVREAKLALANAAEVAEQCEADCSLQSAVDDQILAEVKQWCGDGGDIERRKASNSLLVKFLGDESADTWSKVHSATSKAKEVLKTSSDQSDNAKIYCGDSSFVRQAGLWKDEDSEYADIAWTADKTSPQRPCEKVIGLGLYQTGATHKGILLCNYKDMLDTKTSHTVAGNYFSYSNLLDSTTDVPIAAFADKISSVLIHEMIHLGDMQQCKSFESPTNVYADIP
ncbi:hypothetical protein N7481_012925 [Penicillium waksmanii]|uniref:uncharacterized protein n=1 Tax=Penicillium waksmanii TaxID=69791 RepID=UPI0025499FA4|nr:uncharacterized protein N7481_012925 [Penicillium waksmanii]KAJ5966211.1 hypothetical protein N7481_012925 [Penicillium waksmanii]